jgi:hypothetical protein
LILKAEILGYIGVADRSCKAEWSSPSSSEQQELVSFGMTTYDKKEIEGAETISGPYELFSGSFRLEFLQIPEGLDAT